MADKQQIFPALARSILARRDAQNDEMIAFAETHTKLSREWIIRGAEMSRGRRRAVILAPGILEPIKELCSLFEEVVLVGHDGDTLAKLGGRAANIQVVESDLAGQLFAACGKEIENLGSKGGSAVDLLSSFTRLIEADTACCMDQQLMRLSPADYVVSSNVLSQLPLQVIDFMMQLAAPADHSLSAAYVSLADRFQGALAAWKAVVFARHIRMLHALTAVSGRGQHPHVYLSDTTAKMRFFKSEEGAWDCEAGQKIDGWDQIQGEVDRLFTGLDGTKWLWDPLEGKKTAPSTVNWYEGFQVQALLMRPKTLFATPTRQ